MSVYIKGKMRHFSSHLIQAQALSSLLQSSSKVHLLEAGFPSTRSLFLQSRLPGSHFFDIDEISDQTTSFPYMLPNISDFQSAMRGFNIPKDESLVVCYDRGGMTHACRVWWNLKVFGRENVSVLDGGWDAWVKAGGRVETGDVTAVPVDTGKGYEEYQLNNTYYSNFDYVKTISSLLARKNPQTNTQLLDVRSPSAYLGLTPTPGLRAGHIPGAINLPAHKFLTKHGTLHSKDTLKKLFLEYEVSMDERCLTVVYCDVGVTATLGMMALMTAGKEKVTVYDGSWAEYVETM